MKKNKEIKDNNTTTSSTYRGYSINTGSQNDLPCSTKALDTCINILESATREHCKVLVTRLDINIPEDINNTDKKITRVIENTKRDLTRKNEKSPHDIDFQYIKATEKGKYNTQNHYHLAIIANGNAIQSGYAVKQVVDKQYENVIGVESKGLVNYSKSNNGKGILINKNSEDFEQQKNDAVHALSYLAKTRTKEDIGKGTHSLTASRKRKSEVPHTGKKKS